MPQEFSSIQQTEVIEDSLPKINKNFESLRSGFSGDSSPPNPVKGQHAYIGGKWRTYNGTAWIIDDAALEQEITNVQQQASNAQAAATAAQQQLDLVSATALSNGTAIQQVQTAVETVQTDLDAVEGKVKNILTPPIGTVVSGYWKSAPAGCLALVSAPWTIATFPDLWAEILAQGMAVPKVTYDAIKTEHGSVGFFAIDPDGVTFWTPHLEDIYTVPATPDKTGFETGDIKLASLPEVAGHLLTRKLAGGYENVRVDGCLRLGAEGNMGGRLLYENGSTTYTADNIELKASLSSPTYNRDGDSEVRTKRVHLLFCVVAYNTVKPAATADMAAMVGDIQKNGADILALGNSLDHVCIIKGASTGAPNEVQDANLGGTDGSITNNTRYVIANPFGINTPVICKVEVFDNNRWAETGWIYSGSAYGAKANYVQGEGIVIQTGNGGVMAGASYAHGGGHGRNSSVYYPFRARVQVWRLKA